MNSKNNTTTATTQTRYLQILTAVCLSTLLFATAAFAGTSKLVRNGRIAFCNIEKGGHYDIFTINSDGTKMTNLTNTSEQDEIAPSFSPDGTRLAYLYKLDEQNYVIAVMDANGANKKMVIQVSVTKADADTLSWSPEGKRIAFTSDGDIYTIEVEGGYPVNLTNSPGYNQHPSFSPDGSLIAFTRQKDTDRSVFVMTAGGEKVEQTALGANFKGGASAAKFSPDGHRFLFSTDVGCNCLVSANTDGTDNIILATSATSADWSPDGSKVVFAADDPPSPTSDDVPSSHIYVMPARGDGPLRQIGPAGARQPDWQPLPRVASSVTTVGLDQ